MAYDNKPNLNNRQFEQLSGDTINLSGITKIYGRLIIENTTGFSSTYNAGTGKVWTSNTQGAGSWETPSSGGITGATNGLSISGSSVVLGGDLTGSTNINLKTNQLSFLNQYNGFHSGSGFSGSSSIWAIGIQSSGKIIVGGKFTSYSGVTNNSIIGLNSDGSIDTGFNAGTGFTGGVVVNAKKLALQNDGKIVVAGEFTQYDGNAIPYLIRLNTNGSVDGGFNQGTGFTGSNLSGLAIQNDGKIIVTGNITQYNNQRAFRIIRICSDGSPDAGFDSGACGYNGVPNAVAVQSDSKIVAVGTFTAYNFIPQNYISRLNSDGSRDTGFTNAGFNTLISTLVIQPDGKIVVGGNFTNPKNYIVRLNTNGSVDTGFTVGTGFNSVVLSLTLQDDGKIIAGGPFTTYNGVPSSKIIRLNPNGSVDSGFTVGTGFNSHVMVTSVQSNKKILAGGYFTQYNGVTNNNIIRLNSDGVADDGNVSFIFKNSSIEYGSDYSPYYTNRSLVDRQYVDNAILNITGGTSSIGGITGATNGLSTASCCRICLGGNLSNDTTIDLATYSLKFNNGSVVSCGATGQGFDSYNDYKLSGTTFFYVPRRNINYGNLGIGYNVINNTLSGQDNTAIGYQVLYNLTTGSHNFGVGCYTLATNTCGSCNIGIGNQVLRYGACGCDNIGLGDRALQSTCGCSNIGIGNQVLTNNLTGSDNIGLGFWSLKNNTVGSCNIGVGFLTLGFNVSGNYNMAIGFQALEYNTIGNDNIAVGNNSLLYNISGSCNIANGNQALFINIGGCDNIATGYQSLYSNSYGNTNIATGRQSLYSNTDGCRNIGVGENALYSNIDGDYNVAMGTSAMYGNICGCENIALGLNALRDHICGNSNIALGKTALYVNTTGSNNIAIGNGALQANIIGSNNVVIGFNAGYSETGSSKLHIANCAICSLICGDFLTGAVNLQSNAWLYFGDTNTDGTWRMGVSGGSFIHQLRVTGVYVNKQVIAP